MPRARDLGLPLAGRPGAHNAITDVPGVRVGHRTVVRDPGIRTGVTAVVPGATPVSPLPAGVFTGNGHGKLIGATQLAELGLLESPVVLTATLSAFRAADALVTWMLARPDCAGVRTFNPVVGECNDGHLSDIRARPVTEAHVLAAIDTATGGAVPEGCVGAGTGTVALGHKAGIGTSSRLVGPYTVGALVQANFAGTLRLPPAGPSHPDRSHANTPSPGRLQPAGSPSDPLEAGRSSTGAPAPFPGLPAPVAAGDDGEAGSCMVVVATDAPLDARQLTRVARRAVFALARVGAAYTHGSGDYGIAFSVRPGAALVPDASLSPLFEATLDAVEEAVLNSLFTATTTTGVHGHTAHAVPLPGAAP
ncbi:P1 family peptidase [Nonomuraea sp. NPDC049725]|uniref:P1 family peptidase n=1 Tax=Nonomuraea sp. NPDC049725 TaxID=3154508 RepID=UPI003412C441